MCAYARPRAQVLEVQEHGRAVHTSREGSKNTLRDSLLRFRALAALRTVTRACLAPSLQLHAASHLQPWPRTCAPSPTLSPTDPVPRGLLTLWARGNTYTPNTSTRNTYATPAQAPTQHLHKQHGTASTAHREAERARQKGPETQSARLPRNAVGQAVCETQCASGGGRPGQARKHRRAHLADDVCPISNHHVAGARIHLPLRALQRPDLELKLDARRLACPCRMRHARSSTRQAQDKHKTGE